jgi:hypothetical protein
MNGPEGSIFGGVLALPTIGSVPEEVLSVSMVRMEEEKPKIAFPYSQKEMRTILRADAYKHI